ncbi:FAD-dependent monooxygenase [Streptomyces sp. XM4193]|uniref:FAD-dependent monooxygenase n=1 Tax=Streptomyces sp. XM4193 TaxID=2929782 RepID=UPI001FFAAB37|nr:FAD-dependent monooxygenase [Streptomyces sp. XM4193]MCK1798019.1 FAD-dependent monooxygenase [Streptomyces sp. XM4193]
MTRSDEWTDVLIVGGGPVGMALALDLKYRGIDCVIADAGDGEVRHPKVSTIGPRSMELFRRWGVADAVRNAGWPADHPLDIAWVTQVGGHEVFRYRRGTAADRPAFAHTPEPDQICPAHWLNPVLTKAVGVHPDGPLRLRTTVDDVTDGEDHVTATVTDHASGTTHTLRARYLVACDGASSPIRRSCGIDAPARHRKQIFRNILFRAPELAEQLGDRAALVYFLMLSTTLRFPLRSLNGSDLYNLVVGVDPDTTDDENSAGRADALSLVKDALALDTPVELLSDGEWHLTHRVADRYRAGRVFLSGDAAHTLSPSGGFGLNTGIADAADLGWKLAATLRGWGGDHLLDTYDADRRPIAVESLEEANANLQRTMRREVPPEIHLDGPEGEQARAAMADRLRNSGAPREFDAPQIHFGLRYRSSTIVEDPRVPVREGKPDEDWRPGSEPGYRAAHAWWDDSTSTLDLFGSGYVLLGFSPAGSGDGGADGADTAGLERAFADRGVPLAVHLSRAAGTTGGTDRDELASLYERRWVLVRPDGHVAWRGDELPERTGEFVDTVRGHLPVA